MGYSYTPPVLEKWWAVIYEYSKVEFIPEEKDLYLIESYNQFVKNNKPREAELL